VIQVFSVGFAERAHPSVRSNHKLQRTKIKCSVYYIKETLSNILVNFSPFFISSHDISWCLVLFSTVQNVREKRICFGKQETEEINSEHNARFGIIIILYVTVYKLLQTSCLSSYVISKDATQELHLTPQNKIKNYYRFSSDIHELNYIPATFSATRTQDSHSLRTVTRNVYSEINS